ncbi:LEF-11 [Pseudalatia unipuncta granulovirus]|uniref:Late expression factor 11 n=1 Tax=Pseudalatia unipuncta granulosis virus TaxID=36355 RepID=B6S6S3_GVPU|nr:LEF-11 [Pseudalatia unipuncta granulovirus]ACH69404.1 LEF-11 [Pseudalatia unipuncta granulovirus]
MLTKSQVYAIVREAINYRKNNFDTDNVTSHVEEAGFASISAFIKRNAKEIFIRQPDLLLNISAHLDRLEYIFNLPKTLEEEYAHCESRNNAVCNV